MSSPGLPLRSSLPSLENTTSSPSRALIKSASAVPLMKSERSVPVKSFAKATPATDTTAAAIAASMRIVLFALFAMKPLFLSRLFLPGVPLPGSTRGRIARPRRTAHPPNGLEGQIARDSNRRTSEPPFLDATTNRR